MDGREPDLWRDGVDVAVVKRPAKLADRERVEMPLLREIVFPVCAPSVLDGGVPLRSLRDLVRHTLIESDTVEADDTEFTWSNWLSRFGLQQEQTTRQVRFSHFGLALSAAIDGLGIALGRSPMVDAELASGRLVRPFGGKGHGQGVRCVRAGVARHGCRCARPTYRRVSRFCAGRSMRVRTRCRAMWHAGVGSGRADAHSLDGRAGGSPRDGDEPSLRVAPR